MHIAGEMVILSVHVHISSLNVRSNSRLIYSHDAVEVEYGGYEVYGYFFAIYLSVMNKNSIAPQSECLMTSVS